MKSSSGGLKNIFGMAASPASPPPMTMLSALAPHVSIDFPKLTLNDSLKVDANQAGADTLIAPNLGAVASVQHEIDGQRGVMAETIREAQREIAMALKAEGGDAASFFPDTRIGEGNEIGVIMEMAGQGIGLQGSGLGSLVTSLFNNSPTLDTIWADLQSGGGGKREEILKATEDRLRAMSAAPLDSRMKMPGLGDILSGGADQPGKSRLDWNGFFDAGYKLKDLMSIDPEDPHQLPEFRQLQMAQGKADEVEGSIMGARAAIDKNGGLSTADIALTNLEVRGAKIDPEDVKALEDAPLLAKRLEPDMDTLLPRPDARPAPGMGMAA